MMSQEDFDFWREQWFIMGPHCRSFSLSLVSTIYHDYLAVRRIPLSHCPAFYDFLQRLTEITLDLPLPNGERILR
jgi:hypothetical protein